MRFAASVRSAQNGTLEARARLALEIGYEKLALLSPLLEEELEALKRFLPRDSVGLIEVFLPYPREFRPDLPPPFRLGSSDREDKRECVRAGTRTIQLAEDLSIPVVLIPPVRLAESPAEVPSSPPGRRAEFRGAFDAFRSVLAKLLDAADRYSVRLAIELGGPGEIPNAAETRDCLTEFEGGPLGVWCDAFRIDRTERELRNRAQPLQGEGEAEPAGAVERSGAAWETLRGSIEGTTLADASEEGKPEEPGRGSIDFEALRPLLEASPVWLIDPPAEASTDSLSRGMELLKRLSVGPRAPDENRTGTPR